MLRARVPGLLLIANLIGACAAAAPHRYHPGTDAGPDRADGRPAGDAAESEASRDPCATKTEGEGPSRAQAEPPRCVSSRRPLVFRRVARIDTARRAVLAATSSDEVYVAAARIPSAVVGARGQIDVFRVADGGLARIVSLPDAEAREATLARGGDGIHVAWDGSTGIHHGVIRSDRVEAVRVIGNGESRYVEPNLALAPDGRPIVASRRSDPGGLPAIMLARGDGDGFSAPYVVREARYGPAFTSPFIAVGADGVVHLAFDAGGLGRAAVVYTNDRDGSFCRQTVLELSAWLPCPSLAVEPTGVVHTLFPRMRGSRPHVLGYARMASDDSWSEPRDVVSTDDGTFAMALSMRDDATGELHAVLTWARAGRMDEPGMPGDRLFHLSSCDGFSAADEISAAREASVALSPRAHAVATTPDGRVHVVYTVGHSTDAPTVVYAVGEAGRRSW